MIKNLYLKESIVILEKYVAISITNLQGEMTYVSPAFCNLTGYTKDKIIYWIDIYVEPIFYNRSIIGYQAIEQNITKETFYETLVKNDTLTGLYSRLAIHDFLKSTLYIAKEKDETLCIIMVDLDNFKKINDLYGHLVGDDVLKRVAKILEGLVRTNDHVGRWGGEEFLIVLPKTSYQNAKELAERLRKGVASYKFETIGFKTASFGVAQMHQEDSFESLLKKADDALYKSKKNGKNSVN
ncbi:sensor domain-containing diguanylate cyclase [Sulfurimonas sp.]|uniref:GGDEF domain-containing protein n=1 Tax=Sulfurimonas sp. TaxID=2022749 RepID=UPI003D11D03D